MLASYRKRRVQQSFTPHITAWLPIKKRRVQQSFTPHTTATPLQPQRTIRRGKEMANGEAMNGSNGSYSHAQNMANEDTDTVLQKSCPMKGGNGPNSYAQNSSFQRRMVDVAKVMITEAIAEKLDINLPSFHPSKPFLIVDMGCSVGLNTFTAVHNIKEAVELKYQSIQQNPEFQVFFNDNTENDFNTLFRSFPPSKQYFAAGVPGSFYGRLFPKSTLHIVHSSSALHWLSRIPKEIVDRKSPGWNGGRIHNTGNAKVHEAYSAQHKEDMEAFLSARAQEIVGGGLLLLVLFCVEDEVLLSQTCSGEAIDYLGSCLMDMAKMGLVSEEKVSLFNLPMYITSPKELKAMIETNRYFNIENMEKLAKPMKHFSTIEKYSLHVRAGMEGVITEYFGKGIVEELFERYTNKLAENNFAEDEKAEKEIELFVCLRRKVTD